MKEETKEDSGPMKVDILPVGEVPDRPYTIRDENDHFSLINFLSDRLKQVVVALPDDVLICSESELKGRAHPTACDYALRVSFWREFEKAMWKGNGRIVSANVYAGICTDVYFYKKFLHNQYKVAWMVRPIQTYQKEMEAILHRATERLWELIEVPIKNKAGKYDAKMAEVLLKAVASVENRVKGMAVQRTEHKGVQVNVVTRTKPNQGIETMESLDERIKQLEMEVNGEESGDSGEDGAGDHKALPAAAPETEREIIDVSTLRSFDPVRRE